MSFLTNGPVHTARARSNYRCGLGWKKQPRPSGARRWPKPAVLDLALERLKQAGLVLSAATNLEALAFAFAGDSLGPYAG